MRRLLTFLFALLLLGAPVALVVAQPPTQQQQQTKEQTVYTTRTGKKVSHGHLPLSAAQ
jgi:hypothetical protein